MRKLKYRNKCWLPYSLIEDAVHNNWFHSLTYLVLLKQVHQNNTFYNFSVRHAAKEIKASHTALSKHIKVLEEKGFIRFQDGHMIINAVKKVAKSVHTFLVPIPTEKKFIKSLSNLRTAIRSAVVVRHLHKQKHVYQEKTELINISGAKRSTKEEMKRYRKLSRKYGSEAEKSINSNTVLSVHGFAKAIKRSKETGVRFKKQLCRLKLISSEKQTDLVSTRKYTRRQFFMLELPAGYFISKAGYIYRSSPCIILGRI